ncbi:hypothetical protein A2V68_00690 [candidate division Kazan bacterium RBG_13_50_9]|uniref:DUF721 domain-containing protein n=1 Tax=candidate division Kazan bacterium RBG_13_50_9 TaxID=1798535 RepID=A0A1F4NSL5_UNCK3|nr:MAG: hypothetical protein A2V68_00690 [candidate division Kazan bacterium RBG_13_50_9]
MSKILPEGARQLKSRAQVEGAQVCKLWHEYAARFLLSKAMEAHEAMNFRDGVLTIEVTDLTYLFEIKACRPKVIGLINKVMDGGLVKRVRYRM